jgi:bifunctional DNA-binding transcriptional regulator/antitoxin component of YhaV-PrlF toxin-antitoxin module
MKFTIHINKRGALTLPKRLLKSLGIENGGAVVAKISDDGVLLKPAPMELYSKSRIAEFDRADAGLGRFISANSAAK